MGQHAGHPAREPPVRRPWHVRDPRDHGRDDELDLGRPLGYELFEGQAVREGSEEYLDSEKYELRPRDFEAALAAGNSLQPFLTRLNEIRKVHPALSQTRTITFHQVDNDALLAYSKFDPISGGLRRWWW